MKWISKFILRLLGWKSIGNVVPEKKCIIIGVPHTSAWDFVISYFFYTGLGGKANVLIKKEFFFWPVGYFVRKMGGLPIDRSKGANVVRQVAQLFNEIETLHLALTPEGTRKLNKNWKAGCHSIATLANVPV
jgi:1-acyl-sn-glycerol-3-phosphate acyltransferase